ncbi:hypothetical protein N0V82_004575 [Gnomoniopsis sp. IMI 355080]|nr:hypothetical protein N0V82_004575 [Gnomoniopsis sp. IMI 355080]
MVKQSSSSDKMFPCRVVIVDGLGNALLYDHTMPYNVDFEGFQKRLQIDTFHPLLRIHDESDYASWAKRLEFLSADKAAIAKLAMLIEQHKHTDYDNLAEWMWYGKDRNGDSGGRPITGEKDFNAFMALARSKKLGEGCLMRVAESNFRAITVTLKHLEMEEDRKCQHEFEEACCDLESRQRFEVQTNTATASDHEDGVASIS